MREKLLPQGIIEERNLLKLYKKEKETRLKQRILAIYLMQRDKISSYEVSRTLEVNPQSVRNWVRRYNIGGMEGLRDKPKGGRPKEIPEEMLQRILEQIDKGQQIWTLKKIQKILRESEIDVSQSAIFYRLQRGGYSWRTGRKSHIKGDKECKESFKKEGLKKV